jgi:hypothetical protein
MVRKINAPIKPNDKGPEVANLQDALHLLLKRKVIRSYACSIFSPIKQTSKIVKQLNYERDQSFYGDTTRRLITILQRQYGLGDAFGGVVEERTADILNKLLKDLGALDETELWVVKGTVSTAGKPRADVAVVAYDRDLRKRQFLGKAQTNLLGAYRIEYPRSAFQLADRLGRPGPWLIVEATAEGVPPAVFEKSQASIMKKQSISFWASPYPANWSEFAMPYGRFLKVRPKTGAASQ